MTFCSILTDKVRHLRNWVHTRDIFWSLTCQSRSSFSKWIKIQSKKKVGLGSHLFQHSRSFRFRIEGEHHKLGFELVHRFGRMLGFWHYSCSIISVIFSHTRFAFFGQVTITIIARARINWYNCRMCTLLPSTCLLPGLSSFIYSCSVKTCFLFSLCPTTNNADCSYYWNVLEDTLLLKDTFSLFDEWCTFMLNNAGVHNFNYIRVWLGANDTHVLP